MTSPHHSPSPTTTAGKVPSKLSIVSPPTIVLPVSYSDAALLHVLATRPESVIPPGKSLRAALLRPQDDKSGANNNADSEGHVPETLQSTVEKIVHRAFWDEARESLSDADPSRQLARLHLLYKDLHTALDGLLPLSHPCYLRLSNPLSPTPSPLLSAQNHLLELTTALQERCSPARDRQLSSICSLLESEAASDLPVRIVQATKQSIEIADLMRKDLANAVLGAVKDEELETEVMRIAKVEERSSVLQIYGAKSVRDRWETWLAEEDTQVSKSSDNYRWIRRLVGAIGANVAISCPLPTGQGSRSDASTPPQDSTGNSINTVPPVFALSSSDLFHLQNHVQALVIAAVLRTIVPLQSTSLNTPSSNIRDSEQHPLSDNTHQSFIGRVLALLMIEVDETSKDAGTTKLVNLADEVLQEYRRLRSSRASPLVDDPSSPGDTRPSLPPLDEVTVRSRVDALLRPTNPVFVLLRKRLLSTLADSLVSALQLETQENEREKGMRLPQAMRAGRDVEREPKRPRLNFSHASASNLDSDLKLHEKGYLRRLTQEMVRAGRVQTKGYEDPALRRAIGDVLGEFADVVEWVRETWADRGFGLEGLDKDEEFDEAKEKTELDEASEGRKEIS